MKVNRRGILKAISALALSSVSGKALAFLRGGILGAVVVAPVITGQVLPIGGIGYSRGMTMNPDGTMFVHNDSTGSFKGTTAAIPGSGAGTYSWSPVLNPNNFPPGFMTSASPYLGTNSYAIQSAPNNSNLVLFMFCSKQVGPGNGMTILLKSTDGCSTWTWLTNYPTNNADGNGSPNGPGYDQSIAIDPNNNSNLWVSDNTQLRFSNDGGNSWTSINPAGVASPAYAMQFDPTTPNRLIVGVNGHGLYVSANANLGASATWTAVTGGPTSPGQGRMGSDGTYYCTDGAGFNNLYRLPQGSTTATTILTLSSVIAFDVDPNNPARVFVWQGGSGGPCYGCTSAANTGTVTWQPTTAKNIPATPDSPLVNTAYQAGAGDTYLTDGAVWFDPWKTTSSTSINLSSLSAGGSTGNITVPAGIPNIQVGRQFRCTNTGTPGNYFIFTVTSYSGTTLTGTLISSAQGFYLGGPKGGTGTFSAWTITAERMYGTAGIGGGVFYVDGFTSGTQDVNSCVFGIEGSANYDVVWPVGGNPCMATQDRCVFQIPSNPWGSTVGVVTGYSPYYTNNYNQLSAVAVSLTDPTFWIAGTWGNPGVFKSTQSGKQGTFTAFATQPAFAGNPGGPIACANSNVIIVADRSAGLYYTQNGGTSWGNMPAPAPTSGWLFGQAADECNHTISVDKTSTSAPYIFYALNSNTHVYKISVPASGSPTVTDLGAVGTGGVYAPGCKLDTPIGHAGHIFTNYGGADFNVTFASVYAAHPAGSPYGLWFCDNSAGGTTWNMLSTTQEVIAFGFGKPATGGSGYPAIYVAGWVGGGSYGIYRCIDFNPATLGSETWQKITTWTPGFGFSQPIAIAGDPNQEGRFIVGLNGAGAVIFQQAGQTNSWF